MKAGVKKKSDRNPGSVIKFTFRYYEQTIM